jgi:putative RNA 2'-phosphotransferase
MDKSSRKGSRRLSWLLRHGAPNVGLAMDPAGWVDIDDVLTYLNISRPHLEMIVRTNDKQRFQLSRDRVRACQGHSVSNPAITYEALEASWQEYRGEQTIWHGTTMASVAQIGREGLLPLTRTHVHCSESPDSPVGRRNSAEVMLGLAPNRILHANLSIFIAPNGVILVRRVPRDAILELRPITRKAKKAAPALRASLGLEPTGRQD